MGGIGYTTGEIGEVRVGASGSISICSLHARDSSSQYGGNGIDVRGGQELARDLSTGRIVLTGAKGLTEACVSGPRRRAES